MKEASGEANMTVITIVLIAIVLAVGTVIVTNLMNSTKDKVDTEGTNTKAACEAAGYTWDTNNKRCIESKTTN